MATEERLAKLEREMAEMKTLIGKKALFVVKDVEETVGKGMNLDIPTFKRRNIMIQQFLRNHTN